MNTTNPHTPSDWAGSNWSALLPSVCGVPPFNPSISTSSTIHHFQFVTLNPDSLNCTVLDPHSKLYFRIHNNAPSQHFTFFQNHDGKTIAVVDWTQWPGAVIEIRDVIQKQLVSSWLPLSADGKYRYMHVLNRTLVWVPQSEQVGLYTYGTTTPELYARFYREEGRIVLEITSVAVQIGLLECCVVAVSLLQSGRIIG